MLIVRAKIKVPAIRTETIMFASVQMDTLAAIARLVNDSRTVHIACL